MDKILPHSCPSCSSRLKVKSLFCDQCETTIGGMFDLPAQAKLSNADQEFVLNFVKFSGSLKQMAKHLNLSYPTVRNMLNDLIDRLEQIQNT